MKCPVCGSENQSMLCPECGFDSSRDYGKYPTLGPVGKMPSVSALRREREAQQLAEAKKNAEAKQPVASLPKEPPQRKICGMIAAVFLLCVGIWIGMGIGKPKPTEPGGAVQMQGPVETTALPAASWEANVLRSDAVPDGLKNSLYPTMEYEHWDIVTYPAFGSEYLRMQIKTVTFLDTLSDVPEDAWDVSASGDGNVKAWVEPNGELYDLYIGAVGGINAGLACKDLFAGYVNTEQINFGENFHTDEATDMSWMFLDCEVLDALTLDSFVTTNVQDMSSMFNNCSSLTDLDVSSFDTSNVQNMSWMFNDCSSLTDLDVSSFDTSNVQNMSYMFNSCNSLRSLNLSGFDTAGVQNMRGMFQDCASLTDLDLSSFDTSNVKDMGWMFNICKSLTSLDLSGFDTSNVQNMRWMFRACSELQKLNLSSFDTFNVQDMASMFSGCESLTNLDLSSFDTSSVKNMAYMFDECKSLRVLDLTNFDMSNVTETYNMFYECPAGSVWQHLLK